MNWSEPSERELIEFAKMVHPYYMDRIQLQMEIDQLKALKDELEIL